MVIRYFGTKEQLFDAALTIDLRLPDLTAVPPAELPYALVRHFLDRWESDPADDALLMVLRSGVTNERAAQRTREIFATQVAPALAAVIGPAGRPPGGPGLLATPRPRRDPLHDPAADGDRTVTGRHRGDAGPGAAGDAWPRRVVARAPG
ncbi:hypothetical protein GCM10009753_36480 [Streptantibioticus ferralitis]